MNLKTGLLLIKNVLKRLAKSVLTLLRLMVATSSAGVEFIVNFSGSGTKIIN